MVICWDCGVERLCSAISRGEDVEYIRDNYFKQRERATVGAEADEE